MSERWIIAVVGTVLVVVLSLFFGVPLELNDDPMSDDWQRPDA